MCITVSKRPTEKTISKWISSRARRMGFKRHDIEDVQQQILLVLMDFEFNPEKSNGASGQTAITAVIDRQLRKIRRTRTRHVDRLGCSEDLPTDLQDDYGLAGVHQARHATDIGVAMKKLCPTARAICEQLSEGQSINEIANRMGVSWHTVNKHLATIRECFASVGLS